MPPAPSSPPFSPISKDSECVNARFLRSCLSYRRAVAGVRMNEAAIMTEMNGSPNIKNGRRLTLLRYHAEIRSPNCASGEDLDDLNGLLGKAGIFKNRTSGGERSREGRGRRSRPERSAKVRRQIPRRELQMSTRSTFLILVGSVQARQSTILSQVSPLCLVATSRLALRATSSL